MNNYWNMEELLPEENFYNEALNYYQSAIVLSKSDEVLDEEYDLFGPIIYLLRHAIELMFKSLIVKSLYEQNIGSWNEQKLSPHDRKLMSMHSLRALYETYMEQRYKLGKGESKELDEIGSIVERFDDVDFSSTFFRYPYDKKGVKNSKSLTEDVADMLMKMPCCLGNFIYHEGVEKFSCLHREGMIDDLQIELKIVFEKLQTLFQEEK